MPDHLDDLTNRVERLEKKTDIMSTAIEDLAAAVSEGFREQREYTELSHARLDAKIARLGAKMDPGFAHIDAKMDAGFTVVAARFQQLERKLDQFIDVQIQTNQLVDRRLRALES